MKCVFLLTVVLIVLGGTFSSAKKPFNLEKRAGGGIVRRDLSDFQAQLEAATYIDIKNKMTCSKYPCLDAVDDTWCDSMCEFQPSLFELILTAIINCYLTEICGKTFVTNTLTNVNISIAPGNSYNGVCYLHGDQVTMTLKNQSSEVFSHPPGIVYNTSITLQYVWEGLTLSCQPADVSCPECTNTVQNCSQISGQSVSIPCCASSLLNQLICLVQQLVRSLGLTLNLLSCNCNCKVVSFLGKRQPDANSAAFQSPVTVTQDEYFIFFFLAQSNQSNRLLSDNNMKTSITFASTIPTQYEDDIIEGVETVFTDYHSFYPLQYNYFKVLSDMFEYIYYLCTFGYC